MELITRKYRDQSIDEAGTIDATIATATMEETFTPEDIYALLQSGGVEISKRFVTRYLSTLSTHLGGFKLVELRGDERCFALYTDERYQANKA